MWRRTIIEMGKTSNQERTNSVLRPSLYHDRVSWLLLALPLRGILKRKELQTEVVNFLILGKALSLDIVSSAQNVRLSAF